MMAAGGWGVGGLSSGHLDWRQSVYQNNITLWGMSSVRSGFCCQLTSSNQGVERTAGYHRSLGRNLECSCFSICSYLPRWHMVEQTEMHPPKKKASSFLCLASACVHSLSATVSLSPLTLCSLLSHLMLSLTGRVGAGHDWACMSNTTWLRGKQTWCAIASAIVCVTCCKKKDLRRREHLLLWRCASVHLRFSHVCQVLASVCLDVRLSTWADSWVFVPWWNCARRKWELAKMCESNW